MLGLTVTVTGKFFFLFAKIKVTACSLHFSTTLNLTANEVVTEIIDTLNE